MAMLKRHADKVDVLSRVPLFAGLSKKELGAIAHNVTEVEIPPGDDLAVEGTTGQEVLIILEGRATVTRGGRKVAELSAGDMVGEMGLVTNHPRYASVRADTPLAALVMDPREFATIMDEHPRVAVKILRTVARRLAEAVSAH